MTAATIVARVRAALGDGMRGPRWVALFVAGLVGLTMLATGAGLGVDRQLHGWRDAIRERPASGRLVFVEIDARSVAAIDAWPWPRATYVEAIRALDRAGAATIAFDVDFSARSTRAGDAALARALDASATPLILASFRQSGSDGGGGGIVESLPRPEFRRRAMLGAVNVFPDGDGLVRLYPFGLALGGVPRPSIGALLAGSNGAINRAFAIDGAIDPASVPRVSFVDLVGGRVADERIRGRTILIGASAIELGDRYPVPRHGVLPGALIQILAAETLLQGSALTDLGGLPALLLLAIMLPLALRMAGRRRGVALAAIGLLLLAFPLILEATSLASARVAAALVALAAAAAAAAIADAVLAARRARTIDMDTGLPNRRALAEAAIAGDHPTTVIAVRIQSYGDTLGVMGSARAAELMTRIAERVAIAVDGVVYRVEANALAWLVEDQGEEAVHRVEGMIALLRPGIEIAGRLLDLNASFGIADPDPAQGGDAVGRALLAADRASDGGARWQRYSAELDRELDWQLSLAGEARQAIAAGDIWVAYQPKLDLASGTITAAEALVRWTHPTRGSISPAEFIPAMEAGGTILELTLHILGRALGDLRGWLDLGHDLRIAVNVSALLPAAPGFPEAVERALERHGVPADRLTLEVTESVSLADPEAAIAALERLSAIGIGLSIDDYGTGQSTLSYLKRLPAGEIKIDQSFIKAMDRSRSDQAMVRSTIELAHELGFKVVAEGIETQEVLDLLRAYGCDVAQGWLIGRPVPADRLIADLAAGAAKAAA